MHWKKLTHLLFALLSVSMATQAQVKLKLQLQADGKTYGVYARPDVDWVNPPANLTHAAQVTVVAPANSLQVINLNSYAGNWQLSTVVQQPSEQPSADYFLFTLVGATADIVYKKNQEVLLFTFENGLSICAGPFELMDNDHDPFMPPNSLGIPAGNKLMIEGAGSGVNAWTGNYAPGSANCMFFANCTVKTRLRLESDGYYHVSIIPTAALPPNADPLGSLRITVKVPAGMFRVHDLTSLQPGKLAFMSINRYDAPIEAPQFDYIVFNMKATPGSDIYLQPGLELPLFKFGNEGSCTGDSIYLVDNAQDPFLAPNSQSADVGQSILLVGIGSNYLSVCLDNAHKAPCMPCAFTPDVVHIDSVVTSDPILCLGGANGTIRIHASGPAPLEYSIDGGASWKANPEFKGLVIGNYTPKVRAMYYGCQVEVSHGPVTLQKSTVFTLVLDLPEKVCAGSSAQLRIQSPQPLPAGAQYTWSGPAGFSASVPDPVLNAVNPFQQGTYSLTVTAPGCSPSTASGFIAVPQPVEKPALVAAPSVCHGDTLFLSTPTIASKYEWISPLGTSPAVMALPGMVTTQNFTRIPKNHKAYLSGSWRVRVTDGNGCVVSGDPSTLLIKPRPQAFASNDGPVCEGASVTLQSNPLPGVEYRWYKAGQNGIWSTQPYPVVQNVTSSESYYLEIVRDGCPSENLAVTTVTLHPKPSVNPQFDYAPLPDCAPQDLVLHANANGTAVEFAWTGPNGFSSTLQDPVIPNAHAAHNGNYTVKATNVWGCSTQVSFVVSGVVDPLDKPQISTSGPVCQGNTVELSVQSYAGTNVSYQWRRNGQPIPGATLSKLFLPQAGPADEGDYDVIVKVDQCTLQSDVYNLHLMQPPVAQPDFFLSNPCEGGTLQLNSNAPGAVAWQWQGPNGFISFAPNPVIYNAQFANVGAYTLTVTGSNGCSTSTSIVVDGILPVPATPVVASNSPVCKEDTIVLQVQNPPLIGTVHYEWVNGNGYTLAASEATVKLPANDPLAVPPFLARTFVNGCPSQWSEPVAVTIATPPTAEATHNGPACPGQPVQLFAAPVPQGQYEWRIQGQTQPFSFEQDPVVQFQATTLVELHVKAQGCQSESVATLAVPIYPAPQAAALPTSTTYCSGDSAVLVAANTTPLTGTLTWTWTGPPATGFSFTGTADPNQPFGLTIPNVTEADQGTYTLVMKSDKGCTSQPVSTFIDVVPTPVTPQLSVAKNILCEGEILELSTNGYGSNNLSYEWYFDNGMMTYLLGTTTQPSYLIPSVMASNTGKYSVRAKVDGCTSAYSNEKVVTVLGLSTSIAIDNSTSDTDPACEGEDVLLSVPFMPGALYSWYGPGGFSSSLPDPVLEDVTTAQAGNYFVVVNLPGCNGSASAQTTVWVNPAPPFPELTTPGKVCEGTDITISVANWVPGAEYDFYYGTSLIQSGPSSALNFNDVTPNQFGAYSVVARMGQCEAGPSDYAWLFVDEIPNEQAFAGNDQVLCPGEQIAFLEATPPSVGTGRWKALGDATILDENDPTTQAFDLANGNHAFVWSLSNGTCIDYSADTVHFSRASTIKAFPDVFFLDAGSQLDDKNLLANDITGGNTILFFLIDNPSKGTAQHLGNGHIRYVPNPYAIGVDIMRYRICAVDCPDLCDTAEVRITLKAPESAEGCFVPNLITPNGDGENEVFFVPCIEAFPGSRLVIYNRYGNRIYHTEDYRNDWDGTFEGQPLPNGTYFFQLTFNDATRTTVNGYLAVLR